MSASVEGVGGAVAADSLVSEGGGIGYRVFAAPAVLAGIVALGAIALFRHFHPDFRVLVIAPKENIQRKWMKELKNFVAHNMRYPDLRVASIDRTPVPSTWRIKRSRR